MTKQTITTEIDIPDGYEFVRIGKIKQGESYLYCSQAHIQTAAPYEESGWVYVIIRPMWQPPSWMRPGWIAMDSNGYWYWYSVEPMWGPGTFSVIGTACRIYEHGKPTVGDFTPPPCDDWRTSKRRIGGGE